MKTLRKHIKEAHPRKIKCEHCDNVFDAKYKLEIHITVNHKLPTYKCDKCEKEFVTQWRLEKHKRIHNDNIRRCLTSIIEESTPLRIWGACLPTNYLVSADMAKNAKIYSVCLNMEKLF